MPDTTDLIHANAGRIFGEMLATNGGGLVGEGSLIGPYHLLKPLGEGGFGTVWKAEQFEPVRREVALKIIKLGMDTVQVLGRFQQERQALASLDHPSIATMLDAGVSPDGRPYFAMELIQGKPITHWCEAHQLPITDRLRIFHQVCLAVHHAHQKGIIHRDLKPNNILVTSVDSRPTPKVIDFGIAKAVRADTVESATLLTHADQRLGTPSYMSPEQLDGDTSIDIRSDIYSLGVILYELVTGVLPFESSLEGDTDRMARERGPQRPSTRLRRLQRTDRDKPPAQSIIAGAPQRVSSDLDWITMRALDRDCERRFQSAGEFAADIQRFLDNEPVLSRPPSFGYVSSRWIKRHRTAFAAVCLVALSMMGGTAVALWQAQAARVAQRSAEKEASRAKASERRAEFARQQAQQAASFVTRLLDGVGKEVKNGRNPEALKAALANSTKDIPKVDTDPELRIELLDRIAGIYDTIGEAKLAIPLLQAKAAEISRFRGPNSEEARQSELEYIKLIIDFGARATGPGLLENLKRRVEAAGERGGRFWLEVQRNLSRVWIKLDHPDRALTAAEELIAEATKQELTRQGMVVNLIAHATALEFAGKYDEALALLEQARHSATAEQFGGLERRVIYLYERKGDFKKGAELVRNKLARVQAEKGDRAAELVPGLLQLGLYESRAGDHAAAIHHSELALAIAREHTLVDDSGSPVPDKNVFQALLELANRESSDGQHANAIAHAQAALKVAMRMDNNTLIIKSLRDLGDFYRDARDLERSYETKRQCYERVRESGANLRDSEQDMRAMCTIRLEQNRPEEAFKLAVGLWAEVQSRPDVNHDVAHLREMAETIVNCYTALKAAKPEMPEPKDLAAWRQSIEEGNRLIRPAK